MEKTALRSFKPKEFASLFGISKDTLLYYDKIGLFSPEKRDSNGYRYYTDKQVDLLSAILSLRSLDVPIDRIKEYIESRSPDKFLALIEDEKAYAEREIERLIRLKNTMNHTKGLVMEAITREKWKVYYLDMPEELILESSNTESIDDSAWDDAYKDFIKQIGQDLAVTIGSRITREELIKGSYNTIKSIYATPHRNGRTIIEKGLYAVIYIKGPYRLIEQGYEKMMDEITDRYRIISDAFEDYPISGRETDDENEFVTRIRIGIKPY